VEADRADAVHEAMTSQTAGTASRPVRPVRFAVSSVHPEAVAVLIGVIVLVGWLLDFTPFVSILPTWPSMKANAALASILAGTSIWLLRPMPATRARQVAGRAFAVGVIVIAGLTLAEYVFGWDLHFDQLLFQEDVGAIGTSSPARMGANATIILTISGLAILLLDVERRRYRPAQILALVSASLALLAFAGYLLGAYSLTGFGSATRISLYAAIAYLALSTAILLARPGVGLMGLVASRGAGGDLLRRLTVPAILIPLLLSWIAHRGEELGVYAPQQTLPILIVAVTIFFLPVIWLTARSLDQADSERRLAQRGMEALTQELQQSVERLRVANGELEAFSYSVSHDLRAPLRAIDGFSRILSDEHAADLPDEGLRYLGLVRTNVHEMASLIDGLLAFSRLGQQELTMRPVDVKALVGQVVTELTADVGERSIEVSVGDLPPAEADPVLLRQVFANLIGNAIKYTRDVETARIAIGSADGGDPPVYFVRDNGAGFDMRHAGKLFRVFQRLHRTEEFEGSGIGLALVARIVARHGGRIWAEAAPGAGATFSFSLAGGTP
jgi:signal transduction histidine kinase